MSVDSMRGTKYPGYDGVTSSTSGKMPSSVLKYVEIPNGMLARRFIIPRSYIPIAFHFRIGGD